MKKMLATLVAGFMTVACVHAQSETKYAGAYGGAAATLPAVVFGPGAGRTVVDAVNGSTDKAGGLLSFYAKSAKYLTLAAPTSGATVISIANTTGSLTNNDMVAYVHADGVVDYTTVASATASNVTLAAGVSQAGAVGDGVYELSLQGLYLAGATTAGIGTNDTFNLEGNVFVTPPDSPLRVTLGGNTNAILQVTVSK